MDNLDLVLERMRAGVWAYEVAEELGWSASVISDFENGLRTTLPKGQGRSEYRAAMERVAKRKSAA